MRRPLVPSIRPRADRPARPARPAGGVDRSPMPSGHDTVCRPRSASLRTARSWSAPTAILSVADPATGERRPLISGPAFDFGPVFSRDGTRFLFLRGGPTDCGQPDCGLLLMVANADGTGSPCGDPGHPASSTGSTGRQTAADRLPRPGAQGERPLHRRRRTSMARASIGSTSGALRTSSRSGQERIAELVFRWRPADRAGPGARHLRRPPGRHGPSATSSPRAARDQNDSRLSPSHGTATSSPIQSTDDGRVQIHIVDLRTGVDKALPAPPTMAQTGPVFSPDARFVAYTRIRDGTARPARGGPGRWSPGRAADSAPS